MLDNKYFIVVLGTDPRSLSGGIALALPSYFRAICHADIEYSFIPTHRSGVWGGKWRYWLMSFPLIFKHISAARKRNMQPLVYVHVGGGKLSFFRKSVVSFFCRIFHASVFMQLHGLETSKYLCSPLGRFFFSLMVSPSFCLCVLTPWWKSFLQDNSVKKPIFVVPNPLGESFQDSATKPLSYRPNANGVIKLLTMTRLEPGKGVDILLEAVPFFSENIILYIAGTGTLLASLQARVTALRIEDKVVFCGWVNGASKDQLLSEVDMFCLPTNNDSFGVGFVEAMAYGLPIIALNCGPISDVVPNGKCGILLENNTPRALAKAITFLALDAKLRFELGSNAKRWVIEQFGAKVVGEKIRNVVKSIADGNYKENL